MRRDELIHRWRDELRRNEEHQLVYGPRFVWLYRSRARIYRLLLRIYGSATEPTAEDSRDETGGIPDESAQLNPACSVLPETLAGKPAKDLGAIRKVLKSVTAANDGFPAGSYSRRDVEHAWIIVASGTRRRSPALYQVALEQHRIAYQFGWEGAQWAIRTRFRYKDRAQEIFSTIQEYRRPCIRVGQGAWLGCGWKDAFKDIPLRAIIACVLLPQFTLLLFLVLDAITKVLRPNEAGDGIPQIDLNDVSRILVVAASVSLVVAWWLTKLKTVKKAT